MQTYSQDDVRVLNSLPKSVTTQVSMLNDQQLRALIDIVKWSRQPFGYDLGRILVGFAGSGKTFMIKIFAAIFRRVALCAPTNKAVKELFKLQTGCDCSTIYSLLGLKMEQYEDTIRLSKAEASKIYKYKFVILDECGMVNEELYQYIEAAMRAGVRFLFVGDPKQLPPIGEVRSLVWGMFKSNKLLKVMRHDNQILELATHIRKLKHLSDLRIKNNHSASEGVWRLNSFNFESKIRRFAKIGAFEENTKIIAWRNKTVDYYNHIVRHVIFGDAVYDSKYLRGDRLVFTSPYSEEKIYTDDEAIVKAVVVAKHTDIDIKCYYLTVDIDGREIMVKTVHEDDELKLSKMLNDLANRARQGDKDMWRSH
jgi:exodeoxyribonuclease-5